jgi:hypothetical protein
MTYEFCWVVRTLTARNRDARAQCKTVLLYTLVKLTNLVWSLTKVMKCFPSPRSKPVREGLCQLFQYVLSGSVGRVHWQPTQQYRQCQREAGYLGLTSVPSSGLEYTLAPSCIHTIDRNTSKSSEPGHLETLNRTYSLAAAQI